MDETPVEWLEREFNEIWARGGMIRTYSGDNSLVVYFVLGRCSPIIFTLKHQDVHYTGGRIERPGCMADDLYDGPPLK